MKLAADDDQRDGLPYAGVGTKFFQLAPVALAAALSFMGSHCQEAHPRVPGGTTSRAAPPASRSAAPKPTGDSPPNSPSEPPVNTPPTPTPSAYPSSIAIPAEHPSPAAIPEVPIHVGIDTTDDKRAEVARAIERMTPAFINCRRRGLAQKPAATATLQGTFRIAITVAHSGKVIGLRFPNRNPRNPDFDAAAPPYPNPTNGNLARVVIPCVSTRIDQWRFKAADMDWWILLDIQVD